MAGDVRSKAVYARFGQELCLREMIAAAALIAVDAAREDGRPRLECVADVLPHASPATRRRLAAKLLQRIRAGAAANPCAQASALPMPESDSRRALRPVTPEETRLTAFARLLALLPDHQARHELAYFAVARADGLIAAIAREILYPYFIEDRIPPPYTEEEFIVANANLLLAPEPILTSGFIADYARRVWDFDCERTIRLALRILRQAGILLSSPLLGERGRVHAYTLAPHSLSLPALLWGLHAEFGADSPTPPAWDRIERAGFARLFVVPPAVVASRLWEAERAGLIGFWSAGGTRRVVLKVSEPEALARLLLAGPEAK